MNPVQVHDDFDRVNRRGRPVVVDVGPPPAPPAPGPPAGVSRSIESKCLRPFDGYVLQSPSLFSQEERFTVDTSPEERTISISPAGGKIAIRRNLKTSEQLASRLRVQPSTGEVRIFSFVPLPHEIILFTPGGDVTVKFDPIVGANVQLFDGQVVGLFRAHILGSETENVVPPGPSGFKDKSEKLFK